jgi:hypothetical protein
MKTCTCLERRTGVFDTAEEELIIDQRKNCQQTIVPNAEFNYFCFNIFQLRCERSCREFISTKRFYSLYLPAVSTRLHVHHRL